MNFLDAQQTLYQYEKQAHRHNASAHRTLVQKALQEFQWCSIDTDEDTHSAWLDPVEAIGSYFHTFKEELNNDTTQPLVLLLSGDGCEIKDFTNSTVISWHLAGCGQGVFHPNYSTFSNLVCTAKCL